LHHLTREIVLRLLEAALILCRCKTACSLVVVLITDIKDLLNVLVFKRREDLFVAVKTLRSDFR